MDDIKDERLYQSRLSRSRFEDNIGKSYNSVDEDFGDEIEDLVDEKIQSSESCTLYLT